MPSNPHSSRNANSEVPDPERLLQLIDSFAGSQVVVAADLVADRFLYGTPKRVSREAPVVILEEDSEETILGGGGNTVANLSALDGQPSVLGRLGADASGEEVLGLLKKLGVGCEGIHRRQGLTTPTKVRILGGAANTQKQQIVRYDRGGNVDLDAEDLSHYRKTLETWAGLWPEEAQQRPVVVLSDYGYGSVPPALLEEFRSRLHPNALILVDSRYRLGDFQGVNGATPNQEEAEGLVGDLSEAEQFTRLGPKLLTELSSEFILVTRGSRGMALLERSGTAQRLALLPVAGSREVTDVTGAGDTVMGTVSLALASGATPLEAAFLANFAGGVVVMKAGTATLDRDELRAAVKQHHGTLNDVTFHTLTT